MRRLGIAVIVMMVASCAGGCVRQRTAICQPGATQRCLCSAEENGVQVCANDGSRWEVCECTLEAVAASSPTSSPTTAPASTATIPAQTGPRLPIDIQAQRFFIEGEQFSRVGERRRGIQAFQRSFDIEESPETLFRIVDLANNMGDRALVERACQLYLERFPSGPHRVRIEALQRSLGLRR